MSEWSATWPAGSERIEAPDEATARTRAAQKVSIELKPIAPPPAKQDTILWTGGSKLMNQSGHQPYLDVGFDGFVYSCGFLPGLGGTPKSAGDLQAVLKSGRDFSKSYLGFWTDTPQATPPFGGWTSDAHWNSVVLPAIRTFRTQAVAAGFAGLAFDQEPYLPNEQHTPAWRCDYAPGPSETQVRAAARRRGKQVAELLAGMPVRIYNFTWPNSLSARKQTSPNYDARKFVYQEWFDGLADGGLPFRLYDSQVYKDYSPEANWPDAVKAQLASIWPQHRSRWSGFGWLTDGPLTLKARANGWSQRVIDGLDPHPTDLFKKKGQKQAIWDRQRAPDYIAKQVAALRDGHPEMGVYGYALVGGAAQFAPMPL